MQELKKTRRESERHAAAATCLRSPSCTCTGTIAISHLRIRARRKSRRHPVIEIRENERKEPTVVGRERGHLL
jgi:hypothetical protein